MSSTSLGPHDPQQIGPYRVLGRLGSGGMGEVYVGGAPDGRLVAVKTVHRHLARDEEFVTRFGREVDAARAVGGSYTAAVVDADWSGPQPWLATEYIPAPTLKQVVEEQGPLTLEATAALATGITYALDAIHAAGIVHRDLTPANVLMSESGPRIIDFGIAKALSHTHSLTGTGSVIGSPGYMSPEHFLADDVGPPADVYAMGAVLVFACTGNGPFGQASAAVMMHRVLNEPPQLSEVPPGGLRDILAACLTKDPAARPNTHQVREMLARAAGGISNATAEPPAGRVPGGTGAPGTGADGRPRRRTVLRAGLVGIGAGLLGVGAVAGGGYAAVRLLEDDEKSAAAPASLPERVRWQSPIRARTDVEGSPPVVVGGRVFVTGGEGAKRNRLYALDASAGNVMWTAAVEQEIHTGPVVSGDSVIVGDGDRMVAFDAGTGAWRWQAAAWTLFALNATSQPAVAFAADPAGPGIVAIDARTGRQRWTAPVSDGQGDWGSVVAGADAVAVADGSSLVVLDASSGAVRWRTDVGGGPTFRPVIAGDTVLVTGAGTPAIRAFDLGSGHPLWTVPRTNAKFAGTDGSTVYIGGAPLQYGSGGPGTSEIRALDLRTGRQRWLEHGGEEIIGAPVVDNGAVYAVWGSAVHALDPATGKKRADYALSVAESGLTVADSAAYLYGEYGKVVAIEI